MSGQVKGVGLEVRNQNNELAIPSNAILPKKLMLGTRDSIYRLRLLPNQLPSSVLQYNSQIAFKLDYE
ncbi:hypothetical protein NUBL17186_46870 [Klebsiella quasipneumoniae]|nr:hypothetical protein NUBL17186_46870 [Klebsiella quasipneumoniae]